MESRIQSYLRFAASQQRDTERIGPFLATFSRHSANPYLNYAIPDDGAAPSLADVNALIAAYSVRGRKPRLEYVAKLAPAVEETLISVGFTVEGRLRLMTCTPGSEKLLPLPPDIELIVPVSEAESLGTAAAQHEAFTEAAPSPEDVDRKRPGYKPPDSFRKQTQDPEIKNVYPMKLAPRIYPWGQCFNLKSKI
jgi:hypothetical protein